MRWLLRHILNYLESFIQPKRRPMIVEYIVVQYDNTLVDPPTDKEIEEGDKLRYRIINQGICPGCGGTDTLIKMFVSERDYDCQCSHCSSLYWVSNNSLAYKINIS